LCPTPHLLELCVVVQERGALDRVTGVDQQRVAAPALLAHGVDQSGDLGQPDVVVRRVVVFGVLEVVPVEDVPVQVGGAHDGQPVGRRRRVPRFVATTAGGGGL